MLEIGSNPYFLTLLMAQECPGIEHLGVNYFGDALPAQTFVIDSVTDARKRLDQTRYFHADIERQDLEPAGQFDLVLFCEVLEHLPFDPAWALYNVVRRLSPGAHLILTTPNPARLDNIFRLIEARDTFSDPISANGIHGRHNREYSARELTQMIEGSGLRVLETRTIDVIPDIHSQSAEAHGYGAYHMVHAVLDGEARLYRPDWLYRGFGPERLSATASLAG